MCEQVFLRDLQYCKFYTGELNHNDPLLSQLLCNKDFCFNYFHINFFIYVVYISLSNKKKQYYPHLTTTTTTTTSLLLIAQLLLCGIVVFSPQRVLLSLWGFRINF